MRRATLAPRPNATSICRRQHENAETCRRASKTRVWGTTPPAIRRTSGFVNKRSSGDGGPRRRHAPASILGITEIISECRLDLMLLVCS
jgi:hypothetical protein